MVKREIESTEVYTITNCDYISPEGPNFLFTIKPYYWEVEPGMWERRDGYHNKKFWPSKQQKQLESMSEAIYILSLGYKHIPDLRSECLGKIRKLLDEFFIDKRTMMRPEAKYVQCVPVRLPMEGDHAFTVSMRFLLLVSRGLCDVQLPKALEVEMRTWFSAHIAFMGDSSPGRQALEWGYNITTWYHAILASHLKYIDPEEAKIYATESLEAILKAYPTPVELFEGEVSRTRPAHYALFTLEPLFLLAALSTISQEAAPAEWIITWLAELIQYAQGIQIGVIEVIREREGRVVMKMRWFEKILARWEGREYDQDLDGSLWEKGWRDFGTLLWGFL